MKTRPAVLEPMPNSQLNRHQKIRRSGKPPVNNSFINRMDDQIKEPVNHQLTTAL